MSKILTGLVAAVFALSGTLAAAPGVHAAEPREQFVADATDVVAGVQVLLAQAEAAKASIDQAAFDALLTSFGFKPVLVEGLADAITVGGGYMVELGTTTLQVYLYKMVDPDLVCRAAAVAKFDGRKYTSPLEVVATVCSDSVKALKFARSEQAGGATDDTTDAITSWVNAVGAGNLRGPRTTAERIWAAAVTSRLAAGKMPASFRKAGGSGSGSAGTITRLAGGRFRISETQSVADTVWVCTALMTVTGGRTPVATAGRAVCKAKESAGTA